MLSQRLTVYLFLIVFCSVTAASLQDTRAQSEKSQAENMRVAQLKFVNTSPKQSKSARLQVIREDINSNTVTIVLGGGSDTQIHIAQDLTDVLNDTDSQDRQTLRVLPLMGDGGTQNALDVMFLRGIDLAIMQSDILAHLRGENWILYQDIFDRVHYITKLYNAEWHVIGKKEFTNIRQLSGKKVNISRPGSGTYITSRNIFELLGIRAQYTNYTPAVALERLRKGELDAVAWIGGAPIDTIQTIGKSEGLHFIPATFFYDSYLTTPLKNVLESFYLPTLLKHEQYPNLIEEGESVPTVANGVVLAVYNWSLSNNEERKQKVNRFIERFFEKFSKFTESGRHPKWKEVNLAAVIPEWKRSNIAKDHLGKGPKNTVQGASYEIFIRMLEISSGPEIKRLSEVDKRKMYQNFLNYLHSR